MKKLIILLFAFIQTTQALNFTITNASFAPTDTICGGSAQWVDVIASGGYSSSDHLKVYINHNNTNLQVLLDSIFYTYYNSLPINGDGSRRVYFNMPSTYLPGTFSIDINLTPSSVNGVFCSSVNDIQYYSKNNDKKIICVYDFYGKKTEEITGFLILLYSDNTYKKVYINN